VRRQKKKGPSQRVVRSAAAAAAAARRTGAAEHGGAESGAVRLGYCSLVLAAGEEGWAEQVHRAPYLEEGGQPSSPACHTVTRVEVTSTP